MIKDEKVGPKGAKVRCKKCSHIMTIRLPDMDVDLADEATIRMPFPDEEEEAEAFFAETLGVSLEPAGEMPSSSLGELATAQGALSEDSESLQDPEKKAALPFAPLASSDLGSLFDDPELKAPASGLFGALDDEELGDAFERAISQRQAPSLQPAPSALSPEPSIVVSQGLSQSAEVEWFVAVDDNQIGPLDMGEIKTYWQQGKIDRDSLCWKSGMRDWVPIGTLDGLFEQLNTSPTSPAPLQEFSPLQESEAAPMEWQPSAASALAFLVKDELQGLAASPPTELGSAPAAEMAPLSYAAASVSSEIPLAPPPGIPPAPAYSTLPPAPAYSTVPPSPSYGPAGAPIFAPPSNPAIYIPPAPPPVRANRLMMLSLVVGGLVLLGLLVVILVLLLRQEAPQPPPAVLVQPPAPLVAPPAPPLRPAETPPPLPPTPQEEPSTDSSQALAQQLLPPPKPARTTERKPVRNETPAATAPTPAPARSAQNRTQDDFDKAFGTSPQAATPKRQERPTSVYVPPPPGGGGVKQSLSDADIMEYILSKKSEVKLCADEQRAKDPSVKGNMVVEWNVAASGRTSQVKVASPNFQGTHFANCVVKRILGWQFPTHRTAGGTRKFNFKI